VVSNAEDALDRLDKWLVGSVLSGWDPYDGLSSPIGRLSGSHRQRQVVVQLVKRAPGWGRSVLRVPRHRMTKTLALVALGLRRAPWLPEAPQRREDLIQEMRKRRGSQAWGYEFDVQTRWGYYPAGSPNAIVTAFVVEAVFQVLDANEREEVLNWLTGPMWAGRYFRYVPGNDTLVHNANLLCARAVERISPGHPSVPTAVETSAEAMPRGGLWPYGEGKGLEWVDNFHTAYVLDALMDLEGATVVATEALDLAVPLYRKHLFGPQGEPYYYAGRKGPVDIHNIATVLALSHRLAGSPRGGGALSDSVLSYALRFQLADGSFVPHRRAVPFVRWNQAHMHRALAEIAG
jgi:hypothetical protein